MDKSDGHDCSSSRLSTEHLGAAEALEPAGNTLLSIACSGAQVLRSLPAVCAAHSIKRGGGGILTPSKDLAHKMDEQVADMGDTHGRCLPDLPDNEEVTTLLAA